MRADRIRISRSDRDLAVRWRIVALGALVLSLIAARATSTIEEDDVAARAIRTLKQPLSFAERHPWLRFAAYWVFEDVEPHRHAIGVLANSGHPAAIPTLIELLNVPDFPYRMEAGIALSALPDTRSVPVFVSLFDDADPQIADMATRALGVVAKRLTDPASIDVARTALAHTLRTHANPVRRVAALKGLVALGSETALFDVFDLAMEDPHPLVRCGLFSSTAAYLRQPGKARITPAHLRTAMRRSLDARAIDDPLGVYARAIHASRHSSSFVAIIERDTDCIDVSQVAMGWLATLGDVSARPLLFRAAVSSDPELQATAAYGLARFSDGKAHAAVVELLGSPLFGVRVAAIEGLGRSRHPEADAVLVRVLEEGSRLDRREAAKALEGSIGASVALVEAFADPAVEVRNEAEEALMRSDVVVQKIEDALETARVEVAGGHSTEAQKQRKERMEEGLGRWQAERRDTSAALMRGLGREDPRVRVRSARALSRYASEASFQLLLEALEATDARSAESAALALGLRGDVRARSNLELAAARQEEGIAVAAVRALQDLRQPEALACLRALDVRNRSPRFKTSVAHAVELLEGVLALAHGSHSPVEAL